MADLLPAPDQIARDLYGYAFTQLSRYVDILATRALERGLLGPHETDRIWDRHILNSAAVADFIDLGSSVIDVGSGAGLPGIPLALLRPDLRVTLLEPLLRRFTFLVETVSDLGLVERVSVVHARAEDHPVRYDAVVARAVAPLYQLVTWCDPLRRHGGVLLALKGQNAGSELEKARSTLRQRRLHAEILTVSFDPQVKAATVVRVVDA